MLASLFVRTPGTDVWCCSKCLSWVIETARRAHNQSSTANFCPKMILSWRLMDYPFSSVLTFVVLLPCSRQKRLTQLEFPLQGDKWSDIMADVKHHIMPGITHWQHPRWDTGHAPVRLLIHITLYEKFFLRRVRRGVESRRRF